MPISSTGPRGTRRLTQPKEVDETLNGKVLNCGNTPVAVEIVFNVYDASGNLVGTFTTPVYPNLAPGWNVTLTALWSNPPGGKYIATAQAFYGDVGTIPSMAGGTVKSFKFTVTSPKKGSLAVSPFALFATPIVVISGITLPAVQRVRRTRRRAAPACAARWLRSRRLECDIVRTGGANPAAKMGAASEGG